MRVIFVMGMGVGTFMVSSGGVNLGIDFKITVAYINKMKKRKEKNYKYEVIFDPNGAGYTVTVPKLPGLVTEGDNFKKARDMAKDAIRCYLESVLKDETTGSKSRISRKATVAVTL